MDISLQHPFFDNTYNIQKICNPLFTRTSITYFSYVRYYHDGTCLFLSTNRTMDYDIFSKDLIPTLSELQENLLHYVFISSNFISPELSQKKYIDNIKLSCEHECYHRLFIVFNTEEFVETFEFSVGNIKDNILNFFMINIDIYENFCIYFRETAKNLIQLSESQKLIFDKSDDTILFNDLVLKKSSCYKDFLDNKRIKNFYVESKSGKYQLSKREFECLIWAAQNKSAKQIARILTLSPRTVESYLINLKTKLACESKTDLIDVAMNNQFIKSFIKVLY